ncbi:MAG: hypothetical protein ABEJ70_03510 [Halobacteriaceae archaeon]
MSATDSTRRWDDPERCPFCSEPLADGGAGFIDHIHDAPPCQAGFDDWRSQIRDDMSGGWGG